MINKKKYIKSAKVLFYLLHCALYIVHLFHASVIKSSGVSVFRCKSLFEKVEGF